MKDHKRKETGILHQDLTVKWSPMSGSNKFEALANLGPENLKGNRKLDDPGKTNSPNPTGNDKKIIEQEHSRKQV
jgi:hypothetical protein